jgi:hypothetical protein
MLHPEPSYRFTMPFEIGCMELAAILSLPNIAHYTPAIALTVYVEEQDGKYIDARSLKMGTWRKLDVI